MEVLRLVPSCGRWRRRSVRAIRAAALPSPGARRGESRRWPRIGSAPVSLAHAKLAAIERVSRGQAYGEVVGACGSCHAEVGAITK